MEELKHECGVAMIRLLKPLSYYEKKYGTWAYGFNKLYLMMEKQHNRGQEGAGFAAVNLHTEPGTEYMFRERAEGKNAITEVFSRVNESMKGELLMGHLRYSTTGKSGLTFVHPFLRRNNWRAKNLCLCGNFMSTYSWILCSWWMIGISSVTTVSFSCTPLRATNLCFSNSSI